MYSIEEIVKYCNDLIWKFTPLSPEEKERIRKQLINICRKCKDTDCINNKDCLVKKAYCIMHDD